MARLTYYVVLPFLRTSDGEVLVDEPIEVSDADRARRQAERVARSKGGAVAFSRRPDRGLVRGRGPDRAEEQDHPALGTTGNAALGAARSAHRFHLHLRGYLPRRWQGSGASCPPATPRR